jgi:hypothetical protein
MSSTNQSEDLIEDITTDEYIIVTKDNLDVEKEEYVAVNCIVPDFTEQDLENYRKQNNNGSHHQSNVHNNSSGKTLPSTWKVVKERAQTTALRAVLLPVTLAVAAVALPVVIPVGYLWIRAGIRAQREGVY